MSDHSTTSADSAVQAVEPFTPASSIEAPIEPFTPPEDAVDPLGVLKSPPMEPFTPVHAADPLGLGLNSPDSPRSLAAAAQVAGLLAIRERKRTDPDLITRRFGCDPICLRPNPISRFDRAQTWGFFLHCAPCCHPLCSYIFSL